MRLEIEIKNIENITPFTQGDKEQIEKIVEALIQSGGLTRVKGGATTIHFDAQGLFQKIELKYFPFYRRK